MKNKQEYTDTAYTKTVLVKNSVVAGLIFYIENISFIEHIKNI